ncbi:MAG: cation diffusion facilitator family transporter [bacterium]|nr:cation diffusion facilitator family transporter [bacterium]
MSGAPARLAVRAACVSLAAAVGLTAVKFQAWFLTGSQAVFSDALESIVNIVAAALLIVGLTYAARPADRDHPFGHGKLEFFAAAFEGGLIFFAALAILWQAIKALVLGPEVERLGVGIVLTFAAGLGNGVLGWWLVRFGRRHRSAAIEADGQHVLSDFWTSAGAVVGLGLVWLTGWPWIDPVAAILTAVLLLSTGWRVVRRAAGGLLDEEDPELLREVVGVLATRVGGGVIRVHHLRAIRAGHFRHLSAHLVVPEFWTVERAHDLAEELAGHVVREMPGEGDVTFHTDPCERSYCRMCDLEACSVRRASFTALEPLTVEEAVQPDEESHSTGSGSLA